MSKEAIYQALHTKLELLYAFETYSQTMLSLSVEHWDEYLDKRSEVIAHINRINVTLAQHIVLQDDMTIEIKAKINAKMYDLQQLESTLNARASETKKELLDHIKTNNKSHKIKKFVSNTVNE